MYLLFIFISYSRLDILLLSVGRHGKILIEKGAATRKSLRTPALAQFEYIPKKILIARSLNTKIKFISSKI